MISIGLMIVVLYTGEENEAAFVPPPFDVTVKQGIPRAKDIEEFGWAEIDPEGMPYKTAVCGNISIVDGEAFIYLTNYTENNTWLKLRVLDDEGNIVAETGLAKPGEYIEKVHFSEAMEAGEKIKLKIMAYEPETYYSAGSVVLNTTVRMGG